MAMTYTPKQFCVYILASGRNGTLYVGVTSDIHKRLDQHKSGGEEGFTARYGTDKLVWIEAHDTAESAITREKQLKHWNRQWKMRLIEETNPDWQDLCLSLFQ